MLLNSLAWTLADYQKFTSPGKLEPANILGSLICSYRYSYRCCLSCSVGIEMCSAIETAGGFRLRALVYSQKGDALQRDLMEVPLSRVLNEAWNWSSHTAPLSPVSWWNREHTSGRDFTREDSCILLGLCAVQTEQQKGRDDVTGCGMWVWAAGHCVRAWEKRGRWRGTCCSCSDTQLLPGADLPAGVGSCCSSWCTIMLWETMLLPLSPDCYTSLLHSNLRSFLKNPTSVNSAFLCVLHCSCLVTFHLPSSLPLPPPMCASSSGFQMSSSKLCKT